MDDFDETIRLNPKNYMAQNNRRFAKYRLGQYEDALKDYDEALRIDPDNKTIQNNRSAALIASKRNEKKDAIDEREMRLLAPSAHLLKRKKTEVRGYAVFKWVYF